MNNIIKWIKLYKEDLESVDINICLKSEDKSYDFRQFGFDLIVISIISLTIKVIIALNTGKEFINLI